MCKTKYCPNCVTEMQKEKRKLGRVTKWYVCPSCGLREQEETPMAEVGRQQEEAKLIAKQKERDQRGYYSEEGIEY